MLEDQQQSDLGTLSRQWFQRVKDIRQMAQDESQRPDADYSVESAVLDGVNIAEILPDTELFAHPVSRELQNQQVFAGDMDVDVELFKPGQMPTQAAPTEEKAPKDAPAEPAASKAPAFTPSSFMPSAKPSAKKMGFGRTSVKRFSLNQKIVILALCVVGAGLVYGIAALLLMRSKGVSELLPEPVARTPQDQSAVETATVDADQPIGWSRSQENQEPLSLQMADALYLSGNYHQAAVAYKKLIGKVSANPQDEILRDFLRLRMAMCLKETAGIDSAIGQLKTAARSTSPIVRVMSNYLISTIEMSRYRYLTTRSRAYEALAVVDVFEDDQPWAQELKRNCHFLIAASLSSEVLSLSDADKDMPSNIWKILDFKDDPFAGMDDEDRLRDLLMLGSEKLSRAMLGPRIQADSTDRRRRWLVTCDGASIDELLNRFAANAQYDIRWTPNANKAGIRQRPISLHLPSATDEYVAKVITGCVGLLANFDENNVITLYNLAEYDYASEQTTLLGKEAIALWRKFLLAFHEDRYLANVHFALGLLYAQQDQAVEALAEYKIVANRFPRSPLVPSALLSSGRLKAQLRDYGSAHKDLKQLVEQYPDCSVTGEAHLALAEMADKTGAPDEAAKLYRKIYYLNVSEQSQAAAALAAAEIYYKTGDYAPAQKWLAQYVELRKNRPDKDYYHAYYMLGKTQLKLNKNKEACNALLKAVKGNLPQDEYVDAVSALVEGCIEQGQFIVALDVLEDTYLSQFSQNESARLMILKSRLLRGMGLVEKAVILLRDRQNYILDSDLKTEMGYELSLCYIEQGQLELAFKKLVQNLEEASPGEIAHKSGLELAKVCMQLDRDQQAIAVCKQVINTNPSEELKQQALTMLADIHGKRGEYENAALALIGQVQ